MRDLCAKCHLSIENLLVWKPTPVFSTGMNENDDSYDEEALLEDNYPLSETGIATLISGMIHAMTNPAQLPNTYPSNWANFCVRFSPSPHSGGMTFKGDEGKGPEGGRNPNGLDPRARDTLPQVFAPDWIFTTAGGLASGFLNSDENQLPIADKALLVLQYAIDRTPLDEFTMEVLDFCTKDSSTDRMGLFQIFQVMTSFAATCSSANHRFYCFQALDRLVQACEDDVKMYLLEQLVSPKCPYESMRAAAVNLVKGTVERAFVKLNRARADRHRLLYNGSPLQVLR
ncbi:MAG: hypothetical protein J3Q66DRAFT_399877 [Benniella sp.]|nr:MAG: hypothetical protein J3Q66DRAFT_399877 [Benniella sp.]